MRTACLGLLLLGSVTGAQEPGTLDDLIREHTQSYHFSGTILIESEGEIVHRKSYGLANLECLVLAGVEPGVYRLVALPLKIEGADASPVRAALVTL